VPEDGRLPEAVLRRLVAPGSVLFSAPQIALIPAEQAFRPLCEGGCPLVGN